VHEINIVYFYIYWTKLSWQCCEKVTNL